MSPAQESPDSLRQEANDLYWNTSEPVGRLGERLGMSRKAVYTAVQPLPSGVTCATCGVELVFPNRTARSADPANCQACGTEVELRGGDGNTLSPATPAERLAKARDGDARAVPVPGPQNRWDQVREDLGAVPPERAAKIGGAAALGVALGAAAVKAIRKKKGA